MCYDYDSREAAIHDKGERQVEDGWTKIVNRHAAMVVGCVRRIVGNEHDTADVVQDVFIEAYQMVGRTEVQSYAGFLRCLATRRAIDCLRTRLSAKGRESSFGEITSLPDSSPQPCQMAEAVELEDRLREALTLLPALQAEVFALRFFDEMNYEEIARELNMTTNAVGLALHEARARLQSLIG